MNEMKEETEPMSSERGISEILGELREAQAKAYAELETFRDADGVLTYPNGSKSMRLADGSMVAMGSE